jgi:transcriptional regulator EpsA
MTSHSANNQTSGQREGAPVDAEVVLRAIESASTVRRRFQFFVWSQSYLRTLLPFDVLSCGAYHRTSKGLSFEVFHSEPLDPALGVALTDGSSALMHQCMGVWMEQRGNSAVIELKDVQGSVASQGCRPLLACGFQQVLVHGVSRPQRMSELETFFIFCRKGKPWEQQHRSNLEMFLPQLHATYLRVLAAERELMRVPSGAAPARASELHNIITSREKQILVWVREGKSNQEIGEQLTISALTVKNHVQKILRKLGAANRAQAVAKAMTLNLLERGSSLGSAD